MRSDDSLDVLERVGWRSGNRNDPIMHLNTGPGCGAVRDDITGDWQDHWATGGREEQSEQDCSQDEIGDRPSSDDQRAGADRLLVEHTSRDPAAFVRKRGV